MGNFGATLAHWKKKHDEEELAKHPAREYSLVNGKKGKSASLLFARGGNSRQKTNKKQDKNTFDFCMSEYDGD